MRTREISVINPRFRAAMEQATTDALAAEWRCAVAVDCFMQLFDRMLAKLPPHDQWVFVSMISEEVKKRND